MLDISIVNKTSPEANWNRQADRRTERQDHVLRQADALTKKIADRDRVPLSLPCWDCSEESLEQSITQPYFELDRI